MSIITTDKLNFCLITGFGRSLRWLILAEETPEASLLIQLLNPHIQFVPKSPQKDINIQRSFTHRGQKCLKAVTKNPHKKKPFWPPLSTACHSQQVAVTNLTACVLSHMTSQHVFPPPCYSRPPSRLLPHAVQTKVFILAQKSQIKV